MHVRMQDVLRKWFDARTSPASPTPAAGIFPVCWCAVLFNQLWVADQLRQARNAQLDHRLLEPLLNTHQKVWILTQQLTQVGLACATQEA
jgi:hypothetical protein